MAQNTLLKTILGVLKNLKKNEKIFDFEIFL